MSSDCLVVLTGLWKMVLPGSQEPFPDELLVVVIFEAFCDESGNGSVIQRIHNVRFPKE